MKAEAERCLQDNLVTERKRNKIICYQMVEENDLCPCGHARIHHQHLLGKKLDIHA